MKCLRCGYCCMNYLVMIVDDPKRGLKEDNIKAIGTKGPERCQHLVGDKPGDYVCAVHDRIWYKKTPCFSHGQIESSKDSPCRMGEYILRKYNADNQ